MKGCSRSHQDGAGAVDTTVKLTAISRPGQRRAASFVALAAAGAAVVVLASCSGGSDGDAPSPAVTPTSSSSPTPSSTQTPSVAPSTTAPAEPSYSGPPPATASAVGTSTLPAVPPGDAADFGDGLVVTVEDHRAAELTASGPGEVSGAGVVVQLEIRNGTRSPVDASQISVTASDPQGSPADEWTSSPTAPARGVLAPGGEVEGTYAFRSPQGSATALVLTITSVSSGSAVTIDLGAR